MKITRKKIRQLIKENLNEAPFSFLSGIGEDILSGWEDLNDDIRRSRVEKKILKEIKNQSLSDEYLRFGRVFDQIDEPAMTGRMDLPRPDELGPDERYEDYEFEYDISEKTGKKLVEYLNQKIKFEYKDGKIVLTGFAKLAPNGSLIEI